MKNIKFLFLLILTSLIIVSCSNKKPDDFRMLQVSNIQFAINPSQGTDWGDSSTEVFEGKNAEKNVGLKIGETIGFVVDLSKEWEDIPGSYDDKAQYSLKTGKKIVWLAGVTKEAKIKSFFNFYRKNCWGNENLVGSLDFELDITITDDFFNKKCLVIGTIENLSSRRPRHACDDDVWANVYLKNSYIEIYEDNTVNP